MVLSFVLHKCYLYHRRKLEGACVPGDICFGEHLRILPAISGNEVGGTLGSGTEVILSPKLGTKGVPVLLFGKGLSNAKLPGSSRADIIFLCQRT
jgi:hypothetical protein